MRCCVSFEINPEQAKRSIAERLPSLSEEQMRELEELLADRTIALEGGARVFTRIWLVHTLRQLRAPRPTLTNFDGEEVVFTKVRFAVAKDHQAEVARLLDQCQNSRVNRKVNTGVGIVRTVSKAAKDRKTACRLPVGMRPAH